MINSLDRSNPARGRSSSRYFLPESQLTQGSKSSHHKQTEDWLRVKARFWELTYVKESNWKLFTRYHVLFDQLSDLFFMSGCQQEFNLFSI